MKKLFPILVILMLAGCQQNKVGWISIQSTPEGASVYLNDSLVGDLTPFIIKVKKDSSCSIRLELEGYESVDTILSVARGDTTQLKSSLIKQGKIKWRFEPSDGYICDCVALSNDGTIIFPTFQMKSYIYAVSSEGKLKWKYGPIDNYVRSAPSISPDGKVFFTADSNGGFRLLALNQDGELLWSFNSKGFSSSLPAVGSDGTIYITVDNCLYALNQDGSVKWKYKPIDMGEGSPTVAGDGTIYFGSRDGFLYAFNSNGSLRWSRKFEPSVIDGPAISKEHIYVGGGKGMHVLDHNGKLEWSFKTNSQIRQPVIGPDGSIYFGEFSEGKTLYAINPDGSLKWEFDAGYSIEASPAVDSKGNVYFGTYDGYLYALSSDGAFLWRLDAVTDGVSPVIGDDGTIFFNSSRFLYAIEGESVGLADSPWPRYQHDNQNTGNAAWPIR